MRLDIPFSFFNDLAFINKTDGAGGRASQTGTTTPSTSNLRLRILMEFLSVPVFISSRLFLRTFLSSRRSSRVRSGEM